jgi:ATP-dependent DNA helicase RecQ
VGALRSLPPRFGTTERHFFQPNGPESYCGIVFSQTVNASRAMPGAGLLNLAATIEQEIGAPVGMYSGSKPKLWNRGSWDEHKRADARAFKENRKTVLIATKAYGMGIDKPNIRYTVHLGVPGSIEAYYQEAGRAGRDRSDAHCAIVHTPADRGFYDFTHAKSYRGIDADVAMVGQLLALLGDLQQRGFASVPMSSDDDAADDEERAIHRLKLLGVISDYLVDWGGKKFDLRLAPVTIASVDERLLTYVRRTQPGRVPAFERELAHAPADSVPSRVMENARRLIEFIYETVVQSRQRALDEMIALAQTATDDRSIRDRILRYLELGRIAGELEVLVDTEPFQFQDWQDLYMQLDTLDDAREWRGATARYLESSPDHPGLLAGRALAEASVPGGDPGIFASNLALAASTAVERYAVAVPAIGSFLEWLLEWLHERRPQWSAIGYLVAERALGEASRKMFNSLERRTIADLDSSIADELGVILARRLDRTATRLDDLVAAVQELSS